MSAKCTALCAVLMAGWLAAPAATATEVRFFRQQSSADFVEGDFEGLALDAGGALRPAPHFERLAQFEEPFVFTARAHGGGWLLGTGNSGRILEVEADGSFEALWTAPEPEIFALWVDEDGTAFAGSSPEGKVYQLGPGGATAVFDPAETYIWDIVRAPWGELLVATGDGGKLYAVAADGASRVLYESAEPHVRALHPLVDSVLIGTAGDGLILSVDSDGRVRTLFDSDQEEVTAFADDGAGQWFAAAVAAEASLTQQASETSKAGNSDKDAAGSGVTIEVSATPSAGPSGARSTVLGGGSGEIREVTSLGRETVYDLAWIDGRLWLGTGVDGNVYSVSANRATLEASVDDRQVVGLFPGVQPTLVTTNGAAVHRAAKASSQAGVYTSQALDAGAPSRFGTLRWRGESAQADAVRFAVRSGLSSEPDATWSDWLPAAAGDALSLADLPGGRFIQWRAEVLPAAGGDARIRFVELSYRQNNVGPSISQFEAMDPGQVLVPASFSPDDQIYEPAHPNREGIFTALRPASSPNGGRLKTLWRRGFLTLRWKADDPNEDALEYALAFRRDGAEGDFLAMTDEIDDSYYSFDASVLPDGVYRFRLQASDQPANQGGSARLAEEISEPVVVDHTPPRVRSVSGSGAAVTVVVDDALNPIRAAEVSIDGGEWVDAAPTDALLDGRRETLRLTVPPAAQLVLLRLTDAAFNVATYDVLKERR